MGDAEMLEGSGIEIIPRLVDACHMPKDAPISHQRVEFIFRDAYVECNRQARGVAFYLREVLDASFDLRQGPDDENI